MSHFPRFFEAVHNNVRKMYKPFARWAKGPESVLKKVKKVQNAIRTMDGRVYTGERQDQVVYELRREGKLAKDKPFAESGASAGFLVEDRFYDVTNLNDDEIGLLLQYIQENQIGYRISTNQSEYCSRDGDDRRLATICLLVGLRLMSG